MEVIVESRSERAWALYGNGMHFVADNNGRYIKKCFIIMVKGRYTITDLYRPI